MLIQSHGRKSIVLTAIAMLALFSHQADCLAGGISIVYDLEADGPESSSVSEFPRLGSGFVYPIVGNIRITLDPIRPFLENVDSTILVPPDAPAPYTPNVWSQPELFFEGEYLFDALSADVSMRFFLNPIVATLGPFAPLPPYELFVELTEGRSRLDLTGGYFGVAAGIIGTPNSVSFSVLGRAIPEPAGGVLLLVGMAGIIANRCRR